MDHPVVRFQTTDLKTYLASDKVIRLCALGPRGAHRQAEFLTPEQAQALIEQLQEALSGEAPTTSR